MWTAAGVQESALAVVIISREDVERETLREEGVGREEEEEGRTGALVAVILQAQSEPKWSRGLMQCNSTPLRCSTQHPGHRAGLLPNRLLNPFRVCVRLPWPSFAHHCTNQPQRQQLQGAPLLTWAGEAVILSKRSANTELSVLNRDRRASTCLTLAASSIVSHSTRSSNKQCQQVMWFFIRQRGFKTHSDHLSQ